MRSRFFMSPCEKNATARLSGAENGCSASSVPSRRRDSASASVRSQKRLTLRLGRNERKMATVGRERQLRHGS